MTYDHIVICGGGFSGLLAAIVAAAQAKRVTVIERHQVNPGTQQAATPQSHHVHIMVKKGQHLLESLLPGMLAELLAHGATEADWAKNTAWHGPFGLCANYTSGINSLLFSRKLIDRLLAARVQRLPNVVHLRASVKELVVQDQRIDKIILSDGRLVKDIDLCIDARGRTSGLREALEQHVGQIPQSTIENTVRYITTVVEHRFAPSDTLLQHYRQANPTSAPLGYFASPIEGGRVIFTAVDYHGTIAKPFEQLRLHPFLSGKEIGETWTFAKLHNQHNHFGRTKRWIDNLVAIGDAVCRLNPVYGHGMTIAIEHVALLAKDLRGLNRLNGQRLQKRIDGTIRAPWALVKTDEMRSPKSKPNLFHRLAHGYLDQIAKATLHDIKLHKISLEVLHRLRSPLAFISPTCVARLVVTTLAKRKVSVTASCREPLPA